MICKAAIGLLLVLFIAPALAQITNNAAAGSSISAPMECSGWSGICYDQYGASQTLGGSCGLSWGTCEPKEDMSQVCARYTSLKCDNGQKCTFKYKPYGYCHWIWNSEAEPVENLTADCEANPNCHWVNGKCLCVMQSPEQIECEKDPLCAWRDGRCICVMPEPEEIMSGPVPNPTEPMPGPVPNPTPNG